MPAPSSLCALMPRVLPVCLRRNEDEAATYDARVNLRIRDLVATTCRAGNQQTWFFSVLARSLSYFAQHTPTRVWWVREHLAEIRLRILPAERNEPGPTSVAVIDDRRQ